jgi:tetratricopeptide (TPR) repeat protein
MGGMRVSRQGAGLVALVAVLLAGCASTEEGREVRQLQARASYERGLGHYDQKQPGLALQAFREAITLDPSVPLYHYWLGRLYLDLGRPDVALPALQKATELDPDYSDALIATGVVLDELGQWEAAVATYRKALNLPLLAEPQLAYHGLGLALYHLQRYREAEEALRFAISLAPRMAGAYYNLGLVLIGLDRREDAKQAFRQARDLDPQSPFGQAALERLRALGEGG